MRRLRASVPSLTWFPRREREQHIRVPGTRTEEFAIGEIFYCMTRDYEPYEDEGLTQIMNEIVLSHFEDMTFPSFDDGCLDRIIQLCWNAGSR